MSQDLRKKFIDKSLKFLLPPNVEVQNQEINDFYHSSKKELYSWASKDLEAFGGSRMVRYYDEHIGTNTKLKEEIFKDNNQLKAERRSKQTKFKIKRMPKPVLIAQVGFEPEEFEVLEYEYALFKLEPIQIDASEDHTVVDQQVNTSETPKKSVLDQVRRLKNQQPMKDMIMPKSKSPKKEFRVNQKYSSKWMVIIYELLGNSETSVFTTEPSNTSDHTFTFSSIGYFSNWDYGARSFKSEYFQFRDTLM